MQVSTLHSAFRDFKEKMEAQQEEQAQELYNRVADLEAHVMDVSGRLEGEFYPSLSWTALAGRRWLLTHGVELAMNSLVLRLLLFNTRDEGANQTGTASVSIGMWVACLRVRGVWVVLAQPLMIMRFEGDGLFAVMVGVDWWSVPDEHVVWGVCGVTWGVFFGVLVSVAVVAGGWGEGVAGGLSGFVIVLWLCFWVIVFMGPWGQVLMVQGRTVRYGAGCFYVGVCNNGNCGPEDGMGTGDGREWGVEKGNYASRD
ncbi:hypothetical protein Tco_1476449 [Tanacetum coccineum]